MLRSDSAGQNPRTSDVHYFRAAPDRKHSDVHFRTESERILFQILSDHISCLFGDIGSLRGLHVLGIHNADDLKADLSAFPGVIF